MLTDKTIKFCNQLNIRLPIIQAPMAGGLVTPNLIKEVSNSGGLGSLPLGYLSIAEARAFIRKVSSLNPDIFSVNIFVPTPNQSYDLSVSTSMLEHINTFRLSIGLPALTQLKPVIEPDINELIELIVDEKVPILSFTFGILSRTLIDRLHNKNIFIIGTATSVEEGLALQTAGCDAVIAQGYEAGGHRGGGFLPGNPGGLIGMLSLIPQMVDALTIPVIASGGIMDGRGIAAALVLGASAVQMGTAFLTCEESTASPLHKNMILNNPAESTCITSVFTGKPVRAFKNAFTKAMGHQFNEAMIPPYPIQHYLTKELRANANKLGQWQCAGLWSGQGNPLSRTLSVNKLMIALEQEIIASLSQLKTVNPTSLCM